MNKQEFWNYPILFAESIRYLIIKAGGMAYKSLIEDVLMNQFEIDREDAHYVTNMAEQTNQQLFTVNPTIWTSRQWPEPQIEDWFYLENYTPSVFVKPTIKGRFFRLWRQFEKIRLTYRTDRLDPAIAKEIADSYWFLIPINKAFTAKQLACAMREYSSQKRVLELAKLLDDIFVADG